MSKLAHIRIRRQADDLWHTVVVKPLHKGRRGKGVDAGKVSARVLFFRAGQCRSRSIRVSTPAGFRGRLGTAKQERMAVAVAVSRFQRSSLKVRRLPMRLAFAAFIRILHGIGPVVRGHHPIQP